MVFRQLGFLWTLISFSALSCVAQGQLDVSADIDSSLGVDTTTNSDLVADAGEISAEGPIDFVEQEQTWHRNEYVPWNYIERPRRTRRRSFWDIDSWMIDGWIQQGATLNTASPDNRSNFPVLFNDRSNDYQLNQLYLRMGKEVDPTADRWDFGGRIDINYGTDSRFLTVPGLEEHDDRSQRWNREDSDYRVALPQAYFDIGMPIGEYGGTLRLGHFYALGGFETVTAPDNLFYSHSYSFLYGQPFTDTGSMWMQRLNETTAMAVAGTLGWDSLDGDTGEWGIRAGVLKRFNDGDTSIGLTGHFGEDFSGIRTANGPVGDNRIWVSLVLKQYLTRKSYWVMQADYGRQNQAVSVLDLANNVVSFETGQWWSVTQYLMCDINERNSAGIRFEWFNDDGNSRIGVPIEFAGSGPAFDGGHYFGLTGGWTHRPHELVQLRQEVRWDFSDVESNPNVPGGVAGVRPFNDRSDSNQLTLAMDLIFQF